MKPGYKPCIVGIALIIVGVVLLGSYPELVANRADTVHEPLDAAEDIRIYGQLEAVRDIGQRSRTTDLLDFNGTFDPAGHYTGLRIVNRSFYNLTLTDIIFERVFFDCVSFNRCMFECVTFRHSGFLNMTIGNCTFHDCRFMNIRSGRPGGTIIVIDGLKVRLREKTGLEHDEERQYVLPGTGFGVFCTLTHYDPTLGSVSSILGVSDLGYTNGTRFVHSTDPDGFEGDELMTTRASVQPLWIYELWFSVIIAAGLIIIISNILIVRKGWRWIDFWKFCGPLGIVVAYMFVLFLLLPWITFFILASGMMIYVVPPAGKETIIPALTILTNNPVAAAISLAVVDLAGALFLIWNFWIIEMIPFLGRWVRRSEASGERLLERRPWFARTAFIGVILFVIFPFQGSGGWGATILGRVIGMGYRKVYLAVVLGTLIGNFTIAYIAYYMGTAILAAFETGEFQLLGLVIIILIVISVIYLITRNRKKTGIGNREPGSMK